ncbi:hypothetical protein J5N97_027670 [Dioscorea zingiberensis]|uniref:Uncharacterized protein n=1 Tax=Dioscorea zingiberensis TaxID=325984 RepID=A0A9D5BXJ3_9LILI|nr:hypothetical protein J5N97_027670 [Dioscorea zingiberensis]
MHVHNIPSLQGGAKQPQTARKVSILRCKMLISLGGLAALASLESLTISECPNLMTVVPSDDHHQSSGGALLPESLTDLTIKDCGFLDTYMGRCLMGLARLSELRLLKCQHMTSLPTVEELMHLTSLKILQIEEFDQLVSVGGLHVLLSSLRFLTVLECPGLFTDLKAAADVATDPDVDALSTPDHGLSLLACLGVDNFSLLPILLSRKGLESLTTLCLVRSSQNTAFTREQEEWFQHLHSLRFLIFYKCERLPSLPSNLTSLTCLKQLHIRDCPQHMTSLPTAEELMHLTSLKHLSIEECELLVSVGGLHVLLSSLQILGVLKCPGLFTDLKSSADHVATDNIPDVLDAHSLSSSFLHLDIDNLSLLPVLFSRKGLLASLSELHFKESSQDTVFTREEEEWLQHLPSLHTLTFDKCERLPSLPSDLTSLTRLEHLHILGCPQVSSLPTLPMSLECLKIRGWHPELERRCQEGGPLWDLIKHIPDRDFI